MEVLGLMDTLESMVLDAFRIPFTKKVILNEEKVLSLIDKMRLVVQGGGGLAREVINADPGREKIETHPALEGKSEDEVKAVEVLQQAYQMAKEIREGADHYADEVLANLEATSTRILRTVKAGRDRLVKPENVGGAK